MKTLKLWAMYSDDDDVSLFTSLKGAKKTERYWRRCAANHIRGPFGPFTFRREDFVPEKRKEKR